MSNLCVPAPMRALSAVGAKNGRKQPRDTGSSRLREILVKAQNKQIVDNSKLRHLLKGKVKHEEEKNH